MFLEFTIKNYRSFKEEHTLSLVAESSKSKPSNVFEQSLENSDYVRLLKAAVIYGANASGKTNLLRALYALQQLATAPVELGNPILFYEPYAFDTNTRDQPTELTLSFIEPSSYKFKYLYKISFNRSAILKETLDYYPKGQTRNLFKRVVPENGGFHIAKLGQDYKKRELDLYANQSILSKFGTGESDKHLTTIYKYFRFYFKIPTQNFPNSDYFVLEKIHRNPKLKKKLSRLIRISDTKVYDIVLNEKKTKAIFENPLTQVSFELFGRHNLYENNKKTGEVILPFQEESKGTNMLFILGARILLALDNGGILLIDEIDTSLHPKLSKLLVSLFQNPKSNPKNAQLIFTTHETTFLDKDLFRKDQIWFTEKDDLGRSELLSVQDFDGVREDTPFGKWYMAGKFGGVPNIQKIEFIYGDGTE